VGSVLSYEFVCLSVVHAGLLAKWLKMRRITYERAIEITVKIPVIAKFLSRGTAYPNRGPM